MRQSRSLAWVVLLLMYAGGCGDDDSGSNANNDNQNQVQPECGNGEVEVGEECDDGSANSDSVADACRTDCRDHYCQDGVVDSGEACDDGNDANNDGCLDDCVENVCGDGIVNEDPNGNGGQVEACDDPDPAICRPDCGQDFRDCGNGDPTDQGESCDDGEGFNGDNPNACRADCQHPSCGDGITDDLFAEECDDATMNGVPPSVCKGDCTLTTCGDGYIGGVEQCDGTDLQGETCVSLGYTGGTLGCLSGVDPVEDCQYDTSGCFSDCGNGVAETGEDCDGADLGGQDCVSLGLTDGVLACKPGLCRWDQSGCYHCGDWDCDLQAGESSANCPTDCYCGDGYCVYPAETPTTCNQDCGMCGDGSCDDDPWHAENFTSCPGDCPCGDGHCSDGDTAAACPADCFCGNNRCDVDETIMSCPADCGRSFGEPCIFDNQCGGITSLPADCIGYVQPGSGYDMPFGFCTGTCYNDTHCAPLGGICFTGDNVCLKPCTVDGDCRQADGYTCTAFFGGNFCLGPHN